MPDQLHLGFDYVEQLQNNWCWAACMETLLSSETRQCKMASEAFSLPEGFCCENGDTSQCDRPLSVSRISSEWAKYDFDAVYHPENLSAEVVIESLREGVAVEVGIKWRPFGGHAVIIVGFDAADENNILFIVFDPLEGIVVAPILEIVSGFDQGNWKWSWKVARNNVSGGNDGIA